MARVRNKEYNTVHHLTSRIAHRVFFLKEDERNDFVSLMMRVSAFSGVELIGWCIMNNHFHIYVYLPEPPQMTDEEVLARFKALKGDAERIFADDGFGTECPTLGATLRCMRRTTEQRVRRTSSPSATTRCQAPFSCGLRGMRWGSAKRRT